MKIKARHISLTIMVVNMIIMATMLFVMFGMAKDTETLAKMMMANDMYYQSQYR